MLSDVDGGQVDRAGRHVPSYRNTTSYESAKGTTSSYVRLNDEQGSADAVRQIGVDQPARKEGQHTPDGVKVEAAPERLAVQIEVGNEVAESYVGQRDVVDAGQVHLI